MTTGRINQVALVDFLCGVCTHSQKSRRAVVGAAPTGRAAFFVRIYYSRRRTTRGVYQGGTFTIVRYHCHRAGAPNPRPTICWPLWVSPATGFALHQYCVEHNLPVRARFMHSQRSRSHPYYMCVLLFFWFEGSTKGQRTTQPFRHRWRPLGTALEWSAVDYAREGEPTGSPTTSTLSASEQRRQALPHMVRCEFAVLCSHGAFKTAPGTDTRGSTGWSPSAPKARKPPVSARSYQRTTAKKKKEAQSKIYFSV